LKGKLIGWIAASASVILSIYSLSGFLGMLTNFRMIVG